MTDILLGFVSVIICGLGVMVLYCGIKILHVVLGGGV